VSHPFVAPPLPLEAPVSDLPGKLVCRERFSLAHFLPCIYIKGTELYSESPLAGEPLGGRPWAPYTELRSGPPKQRHHQASGAKRPSVRYQNRQGCLSHRRRTTAPMASGTPEKRTARRSNQLGSQNWSRCQKGQMFAVREVTVVWSSNEPYA
jgi:hypothetical protein